MKIDINCDLAEDMPNDEAIMPYITSANIACGFHAGNAEIMKRTVDTCLKYGVKIGAHPGFLYTAKKIYKRYNFDDFT